MNQPHTPDNEVLVYTPKIDYAVHALEKYHYAIGGSSEIAEARVEIRDIHLIGW